MTSIAMAFVRTNGIESARIFFRVCATYARVLRVFCFLLDSVRVRATFTVNFQHRTVVDDVRHRWHVCVCVCVLVHMWARHKHAITHISHFHAIFEAGCRVATTILYGCAPIMYKVLLGHVVYLYVFFSIRRTFAVKPFCIVYAYQYLQMWHYKLKNDLKFTWRSFFPTKKYRASAM